MNISLILSVKLIFVKNTSLDFLYNIIVTTKICDIELITIRLDMDYI